MSLALEMAARGRQQLLEPEPARLATELEAEQPNTMLYTIQYIPKAKLKLVGG